MKISNTRLYLQLQAAATPQRPGASSGKATLGANLTIDYTAATVIHTMRLRSTVAEVVVIDLETLSVIEGIDVVATKANGTDYEGLDFGGNLTFINAIVLDRATHDAADAPLDGTNISVSVGSVPIYTGLPSFNDVTHIGLSNVGVSVSVADVLTIEFSAPDQLLEITFVGRQA